MQTGYVRMCTTAHDEDRQEGEGQYLVVLAHRPFVVASDVCGARRRSSCSSASGSNGCTSGGVVVHKFQISHFGQWRYLHIESDWRREVWTRIEHPKLFII